MFVCLFPLSLSLSLSLSFVFFRLFCHAYILMDYYSHDLLELFNQNNDKIKIYSKNGNAGGYISDVMFLNDDENNVKYFLSVSIYNYKQKSYYKRRVIYTSPGIDIFRKISKRIRH